MVLVVLVVRVVRVIRTARRRAEVLSPRPGSRRQHQIHGGADPHDDRRPHVQPQPGHGVNRVDSQGFDPGPTDRVEQHVQGEDAPVAHREPAIRPDDDQGNPDQPQRLIQKRGVESFEGLVAHRPVFRRDLQPPGQRRGLPEQFLVEPVAPSTDCLGQRDAGSDRVCDRRKGDVSPSRTDPRTQGTESNGAPDS